MNWILLILGLVCGWLARDASAIEADRRRMRLQRRGLGRGE